MCGIVGIVARNASLAPDILERATLSLAHRGPDDSGTTILRTEKPEPLEIGLGSRRLAILDLSPLGHQPMKDEATGNWIVFNGEIYNFQDLRQKLDREGVRFAGHSDTEVLLKAYGRWGERCLTELRGMFAFAIWDARHQRLFLARDPMGIKPLYYFQSAHNFLFASEVRSLLVTAEGIYAGTSTPVRRRGGASSSASGERASPTSAVAAYAASTKPANESGAKRATQGWVGSP